MAYLVAHQGMVHRWAASNLRLYEARLRTVDPDVPATVFLNDRPTATRCHRGQPDRLRRGLDPPLRRGRLVQSHSIRSDADAVFTGSAPQLYLGMWNRSTEIDVSGRQGVLEPWRACQRVRWS